MRDLAEEEAVRWAVRSPLSAMDQRELDRWLQQDRRHQGLFLRALAGRNLIEEALTPSCDDARDDQAPGFMTRRRWLLTGTGALAAAVIGTIGLQRFGTQHVATERGEIRRLPLMDGSVATINSNSELQIAITSDDRRVELGRGQAWFQVAKDRARPFVVDAGVAQVRAVGTAFSVSRDDSGVQVAVTEGIVAIWPTESSGDMKILKTGDVARFDHRGASPKVDFAPAEIERTLAWRNGELSLQNQTLGYAIEQFNSYNRQQLVLEDQELASQRLVGLFKLDRPGDFAVMLHIAFDIQLTVQADEIRLFRDRPGERDGNFGQATHVK